MVLNVLHMLTERKIVLRHVNRKEDSACRERKTVLTHVDRKEDSATEFGRKEGGCFQTFTERRLVLICRGEQRRR